ncbi:hypothetical protein [Chryseobacterium mucoviscidosis]|uniref:hypothetical protein n=1 Tax=Chryseobacterium mucoviscidosis TaxID=1945581 RepID=UPI0030163A46
MKKSTRKRVLLFSLFIICTFYKSQIFKRFSDQKEFDSLWIVQNQKELLLTKNNYKNFNFDKIEKVFYKGKHIDYSLNNDTLVFFDKVREIEEISIKKINLDDKLEKDVSTTKLKNNYFCLQTNYSTAILIQFDTENKETYVKNITLFPKLIYNLLERATIEISLLPIVNNLPDSSNPILTFSKDYNDVKKNKWVIQLPRIIKYPTKGFVLSLELKYNKNNVDALFFQSTSDVPTYNYNLKYYGGWKITHPTTGFMYKLKILQ